ncbi:DIS3-like exonuclease 2 [Hypsibius exemplaris]|uniref:DIS3-like exonuclease 2 n=1 Tax=Hypsibius exemplaris TaxID=2072580 RepID=A0A1W0WN64_HYPEX|nr:DIS3-like exonuclease 2 [Hypsibius exemplaris]
MRPTDPDVTLVQTCSGDSPTLMESEGTSPLEEAAAECSYCGQQGDAFLIQCLEINCGLYFCNGCTSKESSQGRLESHIISHQRVSRHHKIAVSHRDVHSSEHGPTFEHKQGYYTVGCCPLDSDTISLTDDSSNSGPNDGSCISGSGRFCELRQITWKKYRVESKVLPMIDRSHPTWNHFNEELAQVPSEIDQNGCTLISRKDINAQERAWFLSKSGLAQLLNKPDLLGAPVYSFMTADDYDRHFSGLFEVDRAVSRTITLINWDKDDPSSRAIKWLEFETTAEIHKTELSLLQNARKTVDLLLARLELAVPVHIVSIRSRKDTMIFRVDFHDPAAPSGKWDTNMDNSPVTEEDLTGIFGIRIGYEETRYNRQLSALNRFITNSDFHAHQSVIFRSILGTCGGSLLPRVERDWSINLAQRHYNLAPSQQTLNEYQETAVQMALNEPICLIQGPPGTGKTHTLAAIVRNVLFLWPKAKILCVAPSNVPTDNIALRLAEEFGDKVLRISSKKDQGRAVSDASQALTLHHRLKHDSNVLRDMNESDDEILYQEAWNEEAGKLIARCSIICTTCNAAGSYNLRKVYFSNVFIDEATQASELDALIPITKARKRVVLIGDEHQLAVPKNIRFPELDHSNVNISIFERMIHLKQVPRVMLQMQYRMHISICDPVSKVIYGGRLHTELEVSKRRLSDKLSFIMRRLRPAEADIIRRIVAKLIKGGVLPKDIGVITFYSAQKLFLRDDILAEHVAQSLVVDTVDHFQGGEQEFILLSCVRSGKPSYGAIVGFLDEIRRMTVALTRAKMGLVIVGNRELLESAKKDHWKRVIGHYPVIVETGTLTVNALSPEQAYVRVLGKDNDINISGRYDRSDAMHGDLVIVEVHPPEEWKICSDALEEVQSFFQLTDLGDCVTVEDIKYLIDYGQYPARSSSYAAARDPNEAFESQGRIWMDIVNHYLAPGDVEPHWLQRTGKVVSIMASTGNRDFVGCIPAGLGVQWNSTRKAFLLEPIDPRMPRAWIRMRDTPEELRKRVADETDLHLRTEYFYASYTDSHTEQSGSTSHFGRITGINDRRAGMAMTHTKNILVENRIRNDGYPVDQVQTIIEKSIALHLAEPEESSEDFREQCVFTIDPPAAGDLDDAVSYRRLTNGNSEVGVHIADVSSFVEVGSKLDQHLRERGCSVYTIDKVVHMMPETLVYQCSLLKDKERRVVSVVYEISPAGMIVKYRITRGRICSWAQLTYSDAEVIIQKLSVSEHLSDSGDREAEVCHAIRSVNAITQMLRTKRFARGARAVNLGKTEYGKGKDGLPMLIPEDHLQSSQLIEELALLTNCIAAWEIQKAFPNVALLRRQQPPRADVLPALRRLCKLEGLEISNAAQQSMPALLDEVAVRRLDLLPALQAQCTKKMRLAEYVCSGNERDTHHYSLNVPHYTHMTSPIRRYADIWVHRLLLAAQEQNPRVPDGLTPEMMNDIASACNVAHGAAKSCSAASQSLYMGLHLQKKYGGSSREMGTVVAVYGALRAVDILAPELGFTTRVFLREQVIRSRVSHRVAEGRQLLELEWEQYDGEKIVIDKLGMGSPIEVDVGLKDGNVRLIKIAITPPHLRRLHKTN